MSYTQWNVIQDPDLNSQSYGQLIFNRGQKIHTGVKTASLANGAGESSTSRKMKRDLSLSPCIKPHCKWVKDFHAKPQTQKLEEKELSVLQNTDIDLKKLK